jgi:hypothetical protein
MESKVKLIVAAFFVVMLSGCFGSSVKIVRVPVPMPPPKVELPVRPILLSEQITPETTNDQAVKFMMVDLEELKSYSTQLENLVDAFNSAATVFLQNKLNTEITVE